MSSELDTKTMLQAGEGCEEALTRLVRFYIPALRRYMFRFVQNWDVANDLAQDAMVKAIQRLRDLRDGEKFRAWLWTIARCLAVDEIRRVTRQISTQVIETEVQELLLDQVSPECEVQLWNEYETLLLDTRKAMDRMSATARELLNLKYRDGYSYQEIHDLTGYSTVQIKARLSRARAKLREHLSCLADDWQRIRNEMSK